MDKQEMTVALGELSVRRIRAYSEGSGMGLSSKEHLALVPESTTTDDIDLLAAARNMLDGFSRQVLDLYVDVWTEFGKYRCSVCGRTAQQSRAVGYDCAREC
jgi:hypothetical protein